MLLLIILLIALVFRLISINQSLWLDEAINVLASKNYSFLGMLTQYSIADFHPPGWLIILWFWTKLFGTSEIAVRIPSVIFGVLTIYVIYLIGQKLYSRPLGLLCALLLAANPLHIYYSQEARMYALAVLAVSINFFLFIKLIKKEKLGVVFLLCSNLLVLASDYLAYFIFPAQFIFLIIFKHQGFLKKWLMALILAAALGVWWIPFFFAQLDAGSVASSKLPAWKLIVGAFDPKALPLTFIKFIIGKISYHDKLIYASALLPVVVLFLFLIWRGIEIISKKDRNLVLSWILIPLILATIASFVIPIYSYFRLLFILPAFVILTASGIFSFKPKLKYAFLVAVLVIQIFSASVYLFNPSFQRDDWRALVSFLKIKGQTPVLFESSGTLPPFDYYAKGRINASGALKDFPAKDIEDVADLKNILQDSKDVYLIEYLVDISDPKRLVQKRLAELNYENIEIKNFNGVGFLYHYLKK